MPKKGCQRSRLASPNRPCRLAIRRGHRGSDLFFIQFHSVHCTVKKEADRNPRAREEPASDQRVLNL
jgi:hypothetical protein